jgi:hypothetical protein
MVRSDATGEDGGAGARIRRHPGAGNIPSGRNTMNMNWRTSNVLRGSRIPAALGLAAVILSASGDALFARADALTAQAGQSGDFASQGAPVGTWAVQVTLRDCGTNAPLGPPFNSLVTLHSGGTLSESAGSLTFRAGQRSAGHGVWSRAGRRSYHQRMVALILFDTPPNLPGTPGFDPSQPVSPGFFAGWSIVTHTIRLGDADHFTSAGTNQFVKSNGEVYRSGCSTAVGQRFE